MYKINIDKLNLDVLSPLFTTQWGRRLGWGLMIVLALILTLNVFSALHDWWSDAMILSANKTQQLAVTDSTDDVTQMIAHIPNQHIFGQYQSMGQSERLPITSMHISLTGIIKVNSGGQHSQSKAIISESGQPGKVFEVGDALSSGIKVYAIHDDEVIFDNGGRLEKLPLQRSKLQFQGMPKPLLERH